MIASFPNKRVLAIAKTMHSFGSALPRFVGRRLSSSLLLPVSPCAVRDRRNPRSDRRRWVRPMALVLALVAGAGCKAEKPAAQPGPTGPLPAVVVAEVIRRNEIGRASCRERV